MLVLLREQLEESPARTLFVLAGDSEVVEELAPVAGQRKAKGARFAPRRRKRNILLHRRHDLHRVSPNNWRNRQKDALCPCGRL